MCECVWACVRISESWWAGRYERERTYTYSHAVISVCARMWVWGRASCYESANTRNNLFLIYRRPSPVCLGFWDASPLSHGSSPAVAGKLLQHGEAEEGAGVISLGGDAFLSHPLSPHSTCSVSRWDQEGGAVEGKGRVQHRHARSRKRGRWGRRREMGRRRAVYGRYQPMP